MGLSCINEFKMNYTKIFHQEVKPRLEKLEGERRHTKFVALIVSIFAFIFSVVLVSIFICVRNEHPDLLATIMVSLLFASISVVRVQRHYKRKFEKKLKFEIMPVLMPAFGDFQWLPTSLIGMAEIRHSKLFTRFDNRTTDDNFKGSYKNVPINISETKLTYTTYDSKGRRHTYTEFQGVLISIEIPKKFTGHTIINEKSIFSGGPYKEVKLEDPEFAKRFIVRSNDQVEARYLLTTAFMQRYKGIQRAFRGSSICASFLDNKLLLAVGVNKDLFSLGDLNKPADDTKQFTVFLNEIVSIFEMIEDLKLYQDIGM